MKLPNFKDRKTQLAAGGAAAVVAYALYRRKVAPAGSDTTSGSTTAANGSLTDPVAAAALGQASTETNIVSDLQPLLEQLQQSITGLQSSPTTPPVAPPVKKPAPTPSTITKHILPVLNPGNFVPTFLRGSKDLLGLGTIGAGGVFTGQNVTGGAPVYFLEPGATSAHQGMRGTEPAGTKLFTLASLKSYVSPNKVTEKL